MQNSNTLMNKVFWSSDFIPKYISCRILTSSKTFVSLERINKKNCIHQAWNLIITLQEKQQISKTGLKYFAFYTEYSFKPHQKKQQKSLLPSKQFPKDYKENVTYIMMTYGQFYISKTGYALHQCLKECRLLILLLPSNLNHSIITQTDDCKTLLVSC